MQGESADAREGVARLQAVWGRSGAVGFSVSRLGGIVAELEADGSRATVALQGAQVLSFVPRGQREALWVSSDTRLGAGKPLRGGVPVCWPWFGRHPSDEGKPAHGFVRDVPWQVVASDAGPGGGARISLAFETTESHRALWPYSARVRLDVTLGRELRLDLTTVNIGREELPLTQALHTYFAIADVASASVEGLSGRHYTDHVGSLTRRLQDGPIVLDREVNRVYDESPDTILIVDRAWRRRIAVAKDGSRSTVVWNPWIERSRSLGDMGPDGYRGMVCVETANAGADVVALAPGASHRLTQLVSVQSL